MTSSELQRGPSSPHKKRVFVAPTRCLIFLPFVHFILRFAPGCRVLAFRRMEESPCISFSSFYFFRRSKKKKKKKRHEAVTNPYLTATVRQHDLTERSGSNPAAEIRAACVRDVCRRAMCPESRPSFISLGLGGGGGGVLVSEKEKGSKKKKNNPKTKHGWTSVLNAHRCLCENQQLPFRGSAGCHQGRHQSTPAGSGHYQRQG